MALTKDDLQAISHLFDNKFNSINESLDIMELQQDRILREINDLQFDVKVSERNVRKDVYNLQDDAETIIEALNQNKAHQN